jgi:hypothetical protein
LEVQPGLPPLPVPVALLPPLVEAGAVQPVVFAVLLVLVFPGNSAKCPVAAEAYGKTAS